MSSNQQGQGKNPQSSTNAGQGGNAGQQSQSGQGAGQQNAKHTPLTPSGGSSQQN